MLFGNVQAADVAEAGVVTLHDQGVHSAGVQADVIIPLQHILHQSRGDRAHRQSIGQQDGGFQRTQLLHLDQADALSEAVDYMGSGKALFVKYITRVGDDGGDASVYLTVVERHMAHTHTRHIRNQVAGTMVHVTKLQTVSALYTHN